MEGNGGQPLRLPCRRITPGFATVWIFLTIRDPNEFRGALSKNGYYKRWKETFGPEAWALLEKFSGPLV
jgi:hypothetical protein